MGLPSTRMSCASVTSRAGLISTLPSTETRPSAIQRSASRREHNPARARRLAMRSPLVAASAITSDLRRDDEGAEEPQIAVTDRVFRVPLHADEKTPPRILDPFDDAIRRGGIDDAAGRHLLDRLVMGAVDRQFIGAGH